jgi:hypothetical protein
MREFREESAKFLTIKEKRLSSDDLPYRILGFIHFRYIQGSSTKIEKFCRGFSYNY